MDDEVMELKEIVTYQVTTTAAIFAKAVDEADYPLAMIALWQMKGFATHTWAAGTMAVGMATQRGREEMQAVIEGGEGYMEQRWQEAISAFAS